MAPPVSIVLKYLLHRDPTAFPSGKDSSAHDGERTSREVAAHLRCAGAAASGREFFELFHERVVALNRDRSGLVLSSLE
jgi:hypothetical protein